MRNQNKKPKATHTTLTDKYISRTLTSKNHAQMLKCNSTNQIILRIKSNEKFCMDIPFEYLYDMLMQTARKEHNIYTESPGLLRRIMTMIVGESHLDEILDTINKKIPLKEGA